jgi:hypothetical protein
MAKGEQGLGTARGSGGGAGTGTVVGQESGILKWEHGVRAGVGTGGQGVGAGGGRVGEEQRWEMWMGEQATGIAGGSGIGREQGGWRREWDHRVGAWRESLGWNKRAGVGAGGGSGVGSGRW